MLHWLLGALLLASPKPAAALPPAFVPPPILMYHMVDPVIPPDRVGRELTIPPSKFAAQLAYLHARGIQGISMAQLVDRLETGRPLDHVVVLTFDDGYADQYRYAVPLLRRFGDSATFYIVTGEVGRPRHLTWSEIRSMDADGMDIAAHGVWHLDLSRMTPAEQRAEIFGCVDTLRKRLDDPVDSYAFPSGRFNRETLALLKAANIPLAVTTDRIFVLPPENRLELTRLRVRPEWSAAYFGAAIEAALRRAAIVLR